MDAARILAAWEAGGVALPGADELPLGQREARLLALHRDAFADRLEARTQCPQCTDTVELTASCAALLASATGAGPVEPFTIDGYSVSWRLPTAVDLAACASSGDVSAAGLAVLERCVLAATRAGGTGGGAPVATADLPAAVRAALAERIAAADPLVEVVFDLTCPGCGATWPAGLDAAAFVRAALAASADRLLREVDALARAYGWSEPQILALSAPRRAAYLRLVGDG